MDTPIPVLTQTHRAAAAARNDAADDWAEFAVDAATGGIPLLTGCFLAALPIEAEEYSLSIREDSPPPAPKPIEREKEDYGANELVVEMCPIAETGTWTDGESSKFANSFAFKVILKMFEV